MESRGSFRVGIRLPDRRGQIYWRLPIALLAVVLTVGFSCSKKSEAELANEALQQGIAAQNAGRLAEAAADYREVLVHDPNNKYAYFDLGTHRPDERSAGLGGVELPARAQHRSRSSYPLSSTSRSSVTT